MRLVNLLKDNQKIQDDHARTLILGEIIDHEANICGCKDKTNVCELCYAGLWLNGIISSKSVIEDRTRYVLRTPIPNNS